jgi:hypothetical protein
MKSPERSELTASIDEMFMAAAADDELTMTPITTTRPKTGLDN